MRASIRQLLIESIPQVEGRVYEPYAAGANTPKPYLVVREGVQDRGTEWQGATTIIEVWPYVEQTTFQVLDSLETAVINALHQARFTDNGEPHLVEYLGSIGYDFVDADWGVITRGLRFRVFALGWLSGLTYEPDPVAALRSWTAATWPEIHTDPATWSPADATPGIYWRLVRLIPVEMTAAVTWLDAQLMAHVLAPGAATRLQWIRKLVEGLAKQRRINLGDNSPLFLRAVSADSEADPMRRGQVQVTARFGVLQPAPADPLLNRATVGGDVKGVVT